MPRRPAPLPVLNPGDIVAWDEHHWDVVELRAAGRLSEVLLERLADGARSRRIRTWVKQAEVRLIGHQVTLPGLPEITREVQR